MAETNNIKNDLEALGKVLGDVLKEQLKGLLEGAQADVEAYAVGIATNLAKAARLGDNDLVKELAAQLETLGEKNRIKAVNAAWDGVERVVSAVAATALKLLGTIA